MINNPFANPVVVHQLFPIEPVVAYAMIAESTVPHFVRLGDKYHSIGLQYDQIQDILRYASNLLTANSTLALSTSHAFIVDHDGKISRLHDLPTIKWNVKKPLL